MPTNFIVWTKLSEHPTAGQHLITKSSRIDYGEQFNERNVERETEKLGIINE